jgi:exopolysaccharide production protein ExoZ
MSAPTQYNIQVLRAFAAYAVICHHILDALRNQVAIGRFFADPQIGATGVNVFFVISGFIMALTTARPTTPGRFAYQRLVRIVPIYWLLTTFALALIVAGFAVFGHHTGTDLREVATTFLFIPDIRTGNDIPRMPLLFVGWTLIYEMMFYAIFATSLLIRGPGRLTVASAAILALWLAHFVSDDAYIRWLGRDLILGFAAGLAIWRWQDRLRPRAPLLLGALAVLILASPDLVSSIGQSADQGLLVTVGAAVLVIAAVALERNGVHPGPGWLTGQGDASYSIYLVHPFVIQAIGKLAVKSGMAASMSGLAATVVLMFAASVAVATWFHALVERPITSALRGSQKKQSSASPLHKAATVGTGNNITS